MPAPFLLGIRLHFGALTTLSRNRAGTVSGVYVLWAPRAKKRPTEIGNGLISPARFDEKLVGVFAQVRGPHAERDREVAEAVLLRAAKAVGRDPTANDRSLGLRRFASLLHEGYGVVLVSLSGADPLRRPGTRRKHGVVEYDLEAQAITKNPWRPLRA